MASGSEGQTASADQEEPTRSEEATGSAKDEESQEETQQSAEDSPESDDQEQQGAASGRSMASAIEDVSSLPGETVNDQDGRKIGEVKQIYAVGEDETPMWVTIESATGLGRNREVFVPLARIKRQADEIRVPYSFDHIHESPEVEPEDEISEEDDRALRVYYAIGLADQELVENAQSYASQVPDEEGAARQIDADAAEGPVREIDDAPPAKRAAEAYEKQKEEEGEEHRKGRDATADEIFQEDGDKKDEDEGKGDQPDGDKASEDKSEGEESDGDQSDGQPKAEEKSDGD